MEATEDWIQAFIGRCKDTELELEANKHLKDLENSTSWDFFWTVLKHRNCILVIFVTLAQFAIAAAFPAVWLK